jgi:hypothetical protein
MVKFILVELEEELQHLINRDAKFEGRTCKGQVMHILKSYYKKHIDLRDIEEAGRVSLKNRGDDNV